MSSKAATTKDPRGMKRICMSCSTRFYDLNKRPIVCPNCETEFTGEIKVKTRRSRTAAIAEGQVEEKTAKGAAANDDDEEEIEDDDVVSLDDVEEDDDDEDEDEIASGDLDLDGLDDDDLEDLDDEDLGDLDDDDLDEDEEETEASSDDEDDR